jgi:large subunit ribosomal protein L13
MARTLQRKADAKIRHGRTIMIGPAYVADRRACNPQRRARFGGNTHTTVRSRAQSEGRAAVPPELTIFHQTNIILVCRSVDPAEREGMGTYTPSAPSIVRQWHVIDANGQVLGRVASVAARLLQGKHKPTYAPFLDSGDFVVIVNAARVRLTGNKEEQKLYRYHSGYEGGLREERAKIVRAKDPIRIVEEAVSGMLPKTKLGKAMYRKLKVYAAADHPHTAQQPHKLEVA